MTDLPYKVIKSDLTYIELNGLEFIDFGTALQFFGLAKHNSFLERAKEKRGLYVYDINNYLKNHRLVKNPYFNPPFIGMCAVKEDKDILMERMMRKSNLSKILRYPFSLFNLVTEKCCPYYVFDESPIKYYRRAEIHYTIYRISVTIDSLGRSEELKSLLATEEWLQKIVFSDKISQIERKSFDG